VLWRTIVKSFSALMMLFFFMAIFSVLFATLIYTTEPGVYDESREQWVRDDGSRSPFESIPASVWWAIITMATVGYGDDYPISGWGQLVAVVTMTISLLVLSLPITIIGANFDEEYSEMRRKALEVMKARGKEESKQRLKKNAALSTSVVTRVAGGLVRRSRTGGDLATAVQVAPAPGEPGTAASAASPADSSSPSRPSGLAGLAATSGFAGGASGRAASLPCGMSSVSSTTVGTARQSEEQSEQSQEDDEAAIRRKGAGPTKELTALIMRAHADIVKEVERLMIENETELNTKLQGIVRYVREEGFSRVTTPSAGAGSSSPQAGRGSR